MMKTTFRLLDQVNGLNWNIADAFPEKQSFRERDNDKKTSKRNFLGEEQNEVDRRRCSVVGWNYS